MLVVSTALVAAGIGWWATVAASVLFGTGYGIAAAVFNPRVLKAYADRGPAMVSLLNAMFAAGAILAPLAYVWGGSRPVLVVTSERVVNEPYLDVLIELNWSSGKLVREYTFLLDPADMPRQGSDFVSRTHCPSFFV